MDYFDLDHNINHVFHKRNDSLTCMKFQKAPRSRFFHLPHSASFYLPFYFSAFLAFLTSHASQPSPLPMQQTPLQQLHRAHPSDNVRPHTTWKVRSALPELQAESPLSLQKRIHRQRCSNRGTGMSGRKRIRRPVRARLVYPVLQPCTINPFIPSAKATKQSWSTQLCFSVPIRSQTNTQPSIPHSK